MFDEVRAVPKKSQTEHKRNKPKAKDRGKFSQKTIDAIKERDNYRCVKCGSNQLENIPHHIIFKGGRCGPGTKRNGATICIMCHKWAHGLVPGPYGELAKEGRYWFEMWQESKLDENGDLKGVD